MVSTRTRPNSSCKIRSGGSSASLTNLVCPKLRTGGANSVIPGFTTSRTGITLPCFNIFPGGQLTNHRMTTVYLNVDRTAGFDDAELAKPSFARAFHWSPVGKTSTIPSNVLRAGIGFLPPPALGRYCWFGSG